MSNYRPCPGDEVLLTVRATVDEDGTEFEVSHANSAPPCMNFIPVGGSAVVKVERVPVSLPSRFAATIRAVVDMAGDEDPDPILLFRHTGQDVPAPWQSAWGSRYTNREIRRVVEVVFPGVEGQPGGEQS